MNTFQETIKILSLIAGIVLFAGMLWAALVSVKEHEKRAARIFVVFAFLLPLPLWAGTFSNHSILIHFSLIYMVLLILVLLIMLVPSGKNSSWDFQKPVKRIDERDVMFSRNELVPGTADYEEYYSRNPEKEKSDNFFRSKPGLLAKGTKEYNVFHFASADASFDTVGEFKKSVDGEVAKEKVPVDHEKITRYIKGWAGKLGAIDTGITRLEDYHLYSYGGRAERRNKPIVKKHQYAIAFIVEMDHRMMRTAPRSTVIMESSQQYLESGRIAMQVAFFIRKLGYEARAHIDGNYEVVCPLVARDAGLGELGRMGLLMTPKLGPRVRISVVTTNLPLITDHPLDEYSMIDFCKKCKKCADVCPSKAISFEEIQTVNGIKRWQINQEKCFNYWSVTGTDCGKCVAACPFSHPDNLLHNLVRAGIKHSAVFRTTALKLDDLIYGRKPPAGTGTDWAKIE
jgi:reductive dehalogenase